MYFEPLTRFMLLRSTDSFQLRKKPRSSPSLLEGLQCISGHLHSRPLGRR
jgi:hypothetical protein